MLFVAFNLYSQDIDGIYKKGKNTILIKSIDNKNVILTIEASGKMCGLKLESEKAKRFENIIKFKNSDGCEFGLSVKNEKLTAKFNKDCSTCGEDLFSGVYILTKKKNK